MEDNIYELNSLDSNFLTEDVKKIIDQNIEGKQTVFLGESVHSSGSDFLAKTEFVKYLVTEYGYKDIVFEADFISLLFIHDKRNLPNIWKESEQCKELMAFLKDNNVTIWGFDIQMGGDAHFVFPNKITEFLSTNDIKVEEKFLNLTNTFLLNTSKARKVLSKSDIDYLNSYITALLQNEKVKTEKQWTRILESYKADIKLKYTNRNQSVPRLNPTRDTEMAKNLDFIVKQNPDKKFIVWLANAHMSKCNYEYMKGLTMGHQFRELNPNTSYHIAFGSVNRYSRDVKEKTIVTASKNNNNILYYLPSIHKNHFLDSKSVSSEFRNKGYEDSSVFNLYNIYSKKTDVSERDLLNLFDALVFIGEDWIEVSYEK
nr:erythromycin esterase family protein [uncultured Flavobacterium sp.]